MSMQPGSRETASFGQGTVSRDAVWSLTYSGFVRFATLALSIAVARRLGSSGTGAFGVALQVTALASMLACFNLSQGLTKKLAESDEPSRRLHLIRSASTLVGAFAGAACTALVLTAPWLGRHLYRDATLVPVLAWCGPLVLVTATSQLVEGAFQGLGRFGTLARWGAVVSLLDLVLGTLGTLAGVVGVLVARTIVRGGAVLFAFWRWLLPGGLRRTGVRSSARETESEMGSLVGYAGPALLSASIVLVGQTLLRVLLVRRAGLDAAGFYQAADSLAQAPLLISGAVSVALMPAVSREVGIGGAGLPDLLRRALDQAVGYSLVICLALLAAAPWAVELLFGRRLAPAHSVLVILTGAYGLAAPSAVFGAKLLGKGEVWTAVFVNTVWVVVVLGVFWLAMAPLGALGAAAAIASGYAVLLCLYLFLLVPRWGLAVPMMSSTTILGMLGLLIGCVSASLAEVPAVLASLFCGGAALFLLVRLGFATHIRSLVLRVRA